MDGDRHALLAKLGLVALTCNSLLAIYKSRGDAGSIAFVVSAYAALLLLFHFLRRLERAARGEKERIKVAVWALTTLLTAVFASRVAPLVPPAVAVAVWLMAAATAVGGLWALFLNP